MKHENNGHCEACQKILNRYPKFSVLLRTWFEKKQAKVFTFHCSDAGRGQVDQEIYYSRGASKAHWGESSHNYGCGIDTFFMIDGKYTLNRELYTQNIIQDLPDWLQWGANWKTFPELPHFEIKAWRSLAGTGVVKLVEERAA